MDDKIQHQVDLSLEYSEQLRDAEARRQRIQETAAVPHNETEWDNPELAMVNKMIHSLTRAMEDCQNTIERLLENDTGGVENLQNLWKGDV